MYICKEESGSYIYLAIVIFLWMNQMHSVSHSSFVPGTALWDKDNWCLIEDGSLKIIQTALAFY